MERTMNVQTKSNATRSAKSATARTGFEHTIAQVEGGWMVVAPLPASDDTMREDVEQAEAAILERNAARVTLERDFAAEYRQRVADILLRDHDCPLAVLDETEAKTMVDDGYKNGRLPGYVAADIVAWMVETDGADDPDDEETAADEALTADETLTSQPAATALVADKPTDARVWVLVGEHHEVPGTRIEAYASKRAAEDAADDMVRAMLVDAGLDANLVRTAGRETALDQMNERAGAAHASVIVQGCAIVRDAPRSAKPRAAAPRKAAQTDRAESKQDMVLRMLRQVDGVSGVAITEATGWAPHTVRGFLAGLKKKGYDVRSIGKHARRLEEDGTVVPAHTVYQVAPAA